MTTMGIQSSASFPSSSSTAAVSSSSETLLSCQFHKTRMCPFYQRGHCRKGSQCTYAHSNVDLKSPPDLFKTKLCDEWQQGNCDNQTCRFAHGRHELRSTHLVYKTRLCHFWSTGDCNKGNLCRHAHGLDELREALESKNVNEKTSDEKVVDSKLLASSSALLPYNHRQHHNRQTSGGSEGEIVAKKGKCLGGVGGPGVPLSDQHPTNHRQIASHHHRRQEEARPLPQLKQSLSLPHQKLLRPPLVTSSSAKSVSKLTSGPSREKSHEYSLATYSHQNNDHRGDKCRVSDGRDGVNGDRHNGNGGDICNERESRIPWRARGDEIRRGSQKGDKAQMDEYHIESDVNLSKNSVVRSQSGNEFSRTRSGPRSTNGLQSYRDALLLTPNDGLNNYNSNCSPMKSSSGISGLVGRREHGGLNPSTAATITPLNDDNIKLSEQDSHISSVSLSVEHKSFPSSHSLTSYSKKKTATTCGGTSRGSLASDDIESDLNDSETDTRNGNSSKVDLYIQPTQSNQLYSGYVSNHNECLKDAFPMKPSEGMMRVLSKLSISELDSHNMEGLNTEHHNDFMDELDGERASLSSSHNRLSLSTTTTTPPLTLSLSSQLSRSTPRSEFGGGRERTPPPRTPPGLNMRRRESIERVTRDMNLNSCYTSGLAGVGVNNKNISNSIWMMNRDVKMGIQSTNQKPLTLPAAAERNTNDNFKLNGNIYQYSNHNTQSGVIEGKPEAWLNSKTNTVLPSPNAMSDDNLFHQQVSQSQRQDRVEASVLRRSNTDGMFGGTGNSHSNSHQCINDSSHYFFDHRLTPPPSRIQRSGITHHQISPKRDCVSNEIGTEVIQTGKIYVDSDNDNEDGVISFFSEHTGPHEPFGELGRTLRHLSPSTPRQLHNQKKCSSANSYLCRSTSSTQMSPSQTSLSQQLQNSYTSQSRPNVNNMLGSSKELDAMHLQTACGDYDYVSGKYLNSRSSPNQRHTQRSEAGSASFSDIIKHLIDQCYDESDRGASRECRSPLNSFAGNSSADNLFIGQLPPKVLDTPLNQQRSSHFNEDDNFCRPINDPFIVRPHTKLASPDSLYFFNNRSNNEERSCSEVPKTDSFDPLLENENWSRLLERLLTTE